MVSIPLSRALNAPHTCSRYSFSTLRISFERDGQRTNKIPSVLYNKMLHPLLPFPITGVIWYQGESNANNAEQAKAYRAHFVTLIESWSRGASVDRDSMWSVEELAAALAPLART